MMELKGKKIMISGCLLGENVKYSGGNNLSEKVVKLKDDNIVISVCPEVMGGLPVPRNPGEIADGKVVNPDGTLVDYEYRHGAKIALEIAKKEKIDLAILMSRSPSCGVNEIYDGTFSHKRIRGHGVFASLLIENGFKVIDVEDL